MNLYERCGSLPLELSLEQVLVTFVITASCTILYYCSTSIICSETNFLQGPALCTWYKALDKIVPVTAAIRPVKMMILDQVIDCIILLFPHLISFCYALVRDYLVQQTSSNVKLSHTEVQMQELSGCQMGVANFYASFRSVGSLHVITVIRIL